MSKQKTVYVHIIDVYPVFVMGKKSSEASEAEVSAATLKNWKASIAAFKKTQAAMKKAIDPVPLDPPNARKQGKL